MSNCGSTSEYKYTHSGHIQHHDYILPCLLDALKDIDAKVDGRRLLDLGCGNGSIAHVLAAHGYEVVGVDPSAEGVSIARSAHPDLEIYRGSAYDDLVGAYGHFDVLVSIEVVEHLYDPRKFAANIHSLLKPGGYAIITTPYHGYWKNLAMALSGKLDNHFTVLWDHGHIKFWSIDTLTTLLLEAGLVDIEFRRIGRIPPLAKVMVAIARKPA